MSWRVPLFKIYWDEDDIQGMSKAISSGMNWAVGPEVDALEGEISRFIGSPYCLTFNSGTSALHSALLAHGIGAGDEVIVPSFTFISTANAPIFVGARPVFGDIEEQTFGLDPEDVAERINSRTKAIIPIHYGGCPCRIRELKELAEDHHLILIEDAAESFGADIDGRKVGTFGDSAMLSFCQNKVITTGEGGAVVTYSEELYGRMRMLRSHGRLETSDYFSSGEILDYVALGFNFRMSNLIATLGRSQLKKAETIIAMRRKNAAYLNKMIGAFKEIDLPIPPAGYNHVYQMYTISIDNRDQLMDHIARMGVMTKIYFSPVHMTTFYRDELKYRCHLPVTERVSNRVLTLPMYPHLSQEELNLIVRGIEEFLEVSSRG
ncbi:MAG: DegT/DnrJ/EryC1/StrS family aminotransferase [Methanotrichaceae archaeon]|nr:DegT/DnrJ/EryC1/StrS family aminotransferase [Methanotrichaceae archaeon]